MTVKCLNKPVREGLLPDIYRKKIEFTRPDTRLLSPVFTQCMRPFNSLLLSLAAAQPVLMRHRGHQVDKYVIDVGYHGAGYWVSLRRLLI